MKICLHVALETNINVEYTKTNKLITASIAVDWFYFCMPDSINIIVSKDSVANTQMSDSAYNCILLECNLNVSIYSSAPKSIFMLAKIKLKLNQRRRELHIL